MELSIIVAKIIGVIYISAGIAVLIGQLNFNTIAEDLNRSPALTFIAGACAIMIGLVLIEYHNIWVKNWTVLITLISWAFFIGGLVIVLFPKSLLYISKYYKHSRVWGIFMICFGLFFAYFGFVI